jgi:predicted metal-dependent hydrolase
MRTKGIRIYFPRLADAISKHAMFLIAEQYYNGTMDKRQTDSQILYTITRRKMKNVRLRVTSDGRVTVSAPRGVSAARIEAFVQEHEAFIQRRLCEVENTRCTYYPPHYADGDTFSCLGERLRLNVRTATRRTAVSSDSSLTLTLPANAGTEEIKAMFIQWARKEAARVFSQRLFLLLPRFSRMNALRLSVRDMTTRWGSINVKRGSMSLSLHLLRCDTELIDYVITHELCHLKYPHHTSAFYAALETHYPQRKQLDARLKEYGLAGF